MNGSAFFIGTAVAVWFLFIITALFGSHDAADIQRACGSSGVAQIASGWIDPSLKDSLVVVCRDGRVVKVS